MAHLFQNNTFELTDGETKEPVASSSTTTTTTTEPNPVPVAKQRRKTKEKAPIDMELLCKAMKVLEQDRKRNYKEKEGCSDDSESEEEAPRVVQVRKTKVKREVETKPVVATTIGQLPPGVNRNRLRASRTKSATQKNLKCRTCGGYTDHNIGESFISEGSGRRRINVVCSICGTQKTVQAASTTDEEKMNELMRCATRLGLENMFKKKEES